jgi:hypothetical protein
MVAAYPDIETVPEEGAEPADALLGEEDLSLAGKDGDEIPGEFLEIPFPDGREPFWRAQPSPRDEGTEVAVTGAGLGVEKDRGAVIEGDETPDDEVELPFPGGGMGSHHSIDTVPVRYAHRRERELTGAFHLLLRKGGALEKGVVGLTPERYV